ncbi:rhamnogalacturonan lyase [Roseiconus lacunae]|uniref:rhamnogalacturonan lyase n=1 Tax=Roseiconus lacunae TaxID=2605694 RepID=UPI001356EDEF|nr:rhamnogalacturonan lyase [Roseiconus lacunae]
MFAKHSLLPIATMVVAFFPLPLRAQIKASGTQVRGADLFSGRPMERIDRGLVAIRQPGGAFVSWRLLSTDTEDVAFDLYRREGDGPFRKLSDESLAAGTNYVDSSAEVSSRTVYAVRTAGEAAPTDGTDTASVWMDGYLEIPLRLAEGYRAGDLSIGDLDGDGQYELVLHQINTPRDNSHSGLTGTPILDAFELDGEHLWRIDLGRNIREGEHYTQFLVYDLDGDGCAEVACKTADGTVDGNGDAIGDPEQDHRDLDRRSRSYGRVLRGPEFLTVFDGKTGKAVATVDYVPGREPIDGWGGIGGNAGNDDYGNRCDRFLACVAYLDGVHPSLVMCRGVYGRTVMAAWDWQSGGLSQRWVFDSGINAPPYRDASPYSGMGGHSLAVADVDQDGRDEIVYQAMVVDDDGSGLYSTGLRHGDAMHVSDWYPQRPGLEVFTVQENEERSERFQTPGAAMRDARTGEILWSHSPGRDVGSGLVADIDPRYSGCEAWGGPGGLRDQSGQSIGRAPRNSEFAIWWDGDRLRELISRRGRITKWDWEREREVSLYSPEGRGAPRGPNLIGDLLGDWREEFFLVSPEGDALRLYSTTIPTEERLPTLLQDHQYRLSLVWQNVSYNKPPHPSFFLGHTSTAQDSDAIPLGVTSGDDH